MKAVRVLVVVVLLMGFTRSSWAQLPRTLAYQGVLTDSTGKAKADGGYSFTFRLYDAATDGKVVGTQQQTLRVKRGLFHTVFEELLSGVSMDRPYWLSLQLEGEAAELTPRIALTAVAYSLSSIRADTALYAVNAPNQPFVDSARIAGSIVNNAVTTPKLADGAITAPKIGTGQVVKSFNGVRDNVVFAARGGAAITTSGDTITINAGSGGGGTGIQAVQSTNNTIDVLNPTGPTVTLNVKASGVTTTQLANNAVTTAKLADGAVTMSKIDQEGASSGEMIGWNGSAWAPQASSGWSLTGNAGTAPGTHFMGTTDASAFDIRTNNTVKVRITPKGGIETYNTGGSVYLGEYAGTNDDLEAHFLGNGNVFIGFGAGYSNTSGQWNTSSGHSAFNHNQTGAFNTANGHNALFASTSGSYNTAVGEGALQGTSVASSNTALGAYAGGSYNNGNSSVFLGTNTGAGGDGYSEVIAIGNGTVAPGSNVARFGNSATSSYGGWADWSNVSDGRFKSHVQTDVPGLAFITRLRPITYYLTATSLDAFLHKNVKKDALVNNSEADAVHMKALQEKEAVRYSGFVAQEVEATAKELGYEFSGVDAPKSEGDYYGLRYAQFVVPLVKAVQEQQKMIEAQQKLVEAQQQIVESQQRQIDELRTMVKSSSGAK